MSTGPMKAGFYELELCATRWCIPTYYQDLHPIGMGAYGQVWYVPMVVRYTYHHYQYYQYYQSNTMNV